MPRSEWLDDINNESGHLGCTYLVSILCSGSLFWPLDPVAMGRKGVQFIDCTLKQLARELMDACSCNA